MTDESWHLIKAQSKVTGFLGGKGKPVAISEAEAKQIMFYNNYVNDLNISNNSEVWNFIELTWRTPSILAVTNIQDILELGIEARFNLPGTQKNNWKWRVRHLDSLHEGLDKLKKLNKESSRFNTLT